MKFIHYLAARQPLLAVLASIFLVFVSTGVLQALFGLMPVSQTIASASARYLVALLLMYGLARSGSPWRSDAAMPTEGRGSPWSVIAGLMGVLVLTNFVADKVDFGMLAFDPVHAVEWALMTMSAGVWEEVWFRGLCFGILYRAWGQTRRGVYKAAIVQALLFGSLHLTNAHASDLVYVVYQTGFATLVGFGFAGLVCCSRTLWPAVILHGLINAAGNVDNYFAGPVYDYPELTLGTMLGVIGMFFLFGALPGVWCMNRAPLVLIDGGKTVSQEVDQRAH